MRSSSFSDWLRDGIERFHGRISYGELTHHSLIPPNIAMKEQAYELHLTCIKHLQDITIASVVVQILSSAFVHDIRKAVASQFQIDDPLRVGLYQVSGTHLKRVF